MTLADIIASPDDDAPRLAFADAIEADNPVRAAFIRDHIAMHHARARGDMDETNRLYDACKATLDADMSALIDIPADDLVLQSGYPHPSFERGFLTDVTVRNAHRVLRGTRLFETAPIRTLRLDAFPTARTWDHLAALLEQAQVDQLFVGTTFRNCTADLGDGPPVRVRELRIPGLLITDPRWFTASRRFDAVTHLALSRCTLNAATLRTLLVKPLQGLRLEQCKVKDAAKTLAVDGTRLRSLELIHEKQGAAGIKALSNGGPYPSLSRLTSWFDPFRASGTKAFTRSTAFSALNHLDIRGCGLDDDGLVALGTAPFAPQLQTLNIQQTDVTDGAIDVLVDTGRFDSLETLTVTSTGITRDGAARLTERFGTRVFGATPP